MPIKREENEEGRSYSLGRVGTGRLKMPEMLHHKRRIRTSVGNKLLLMFLKRNPNAVVPANTSKSRSLYIILVFGLFFALMLLAQMISVQNSTSLRLGADNFDDEEQGPGDINKVTPSHWGGVLGRIRFVGGSNADEEKEMLLPRQMARELDKVLSEARSHADSFTPASSGDGSDQALSLQGTGSDKVATSLLSDSALSFNLSQFYVKDNWQSVAGSKEKFYVYSAYFDDRNAKYRYIRVIAATKTRNSDKVVCKLWYTHTYAPVTVNAVNKVIRENWNLKYSAYFVLCMLGSHPAPDMVSVLIKANTSIASSNRMIVHNHPKLKKKEKLNKLIKSRLSGSDGVPERTFAVCVKPMHYNYNKILNLIEFIELNRLLGVSHFVFYNHTIGKEVDCVIKDYIDKGIVTILPWNLDLMSQKEIRTEGLFAALNDCLYRTMYSFNYVLMIDFDEYIVPNLDDNLPSLLTRLDNLNNNLARSGGYSFQNAFFYLQWPDDVNQITSSNSNSINYHANDRRLDTPKRKDAAYNNGLLTLLKTQRKSKLHIHKQRSKCIIQPENVVEMGNHFVWEFMPLKGMINVAPKFAYLHHYRICEFGGDDCITAASTVDRRVPDKWGHQLMGTVDKRIEVYESKCGVTASKLINLN